MQNPDKAKTSSLEKTRVPAGHARSGEKRTERKNICGGGFDFGGPVAASRITLVLVTNYRSLGLGSVVMLKTANRTGFGGPERGKKNGERERDEKH